MHQYMSGLQEDLTSILKDLLKGNPSEFFGIRIRITGEEDKSDFALLNILRELGVLEYEIQDEYRKPVLLTPELLKSGNRYYYVFTFFDKGKLERLIDETKNRKDVLSTFSSEPTLKYSSYVNNDTFRAIYYTKALDSFRNNRYQGTLKSKKERKIEHNKKQIIASLNFDGAFIEVSFGGKKYRFMKNLRGGDTMKILLVVAYKTGIGKRFSRENLKVSRNLVEVFKNNKFGQKGVLSCFADISPSTIQIMPEMPISEEQAERIKEAADDIVDLK